MQHARIYRRVVLLVLFVAGCSRVGDSGDGGEGGAAGEGAGAWTYQSTEPDFSINLPAGGWKKMTKKRFIADFWCPTAVGSPMLAGVMSVKGQTRQQFRASIPEFKANAEKGGDYLLNPTFQEGQTAPGNPYIYSAMSEKGSAAGRFIYVATAAVWLADKGVTVTSVFEGQGRMKSKALGAIEYAEFESAAKSICLSPR